MRLGIMQPYFFPYPGYFDVILKSDQWIVFDVVKYQKRSWMNRNRILNPTSEETFVSIPVRKDTTRVLSDTRTVGFADASKKVLRQLEIYREKAPYYEPVMELVREVLRVDAGHDPLLRDVNVRTLSGVCDYLGIPFEYRICSELDLDLANVRHAGQWALEICSRLGAQSYVNPPAGREIFEPEEWRQRGIDLCFTRMSELRYDVHPSFEFVPNLSILDAMMWLGPEEIRKNLERRGLDPA